MHLITFLLQQSFSTYLEALLALTALGVLFLVFRIVFDPLKHVPGPSWARVSQLWLVRQIFRGDLHQTQADLHKRYGSVVRLAPNEYSLNDLDAFKTIYGHGGTRFPKSSFYYPFGRTEPGHASIFNEQDEDVHGEKRKRIANLYSLSAMLSYEAFVEQSNQSLLSRLSEMSAQRTSLIVPNWLQYYAFDVIGAITVGKPFGFLEHGYDFQGILSEIHRLQVYGCFIGTFYSRLHTLVMNYGPYIGYKPPRKETLKYVISNIRAKQEQVSQGETTEDATGKQDLLEKMFVLREKGKLNTLDIENSISGNIVAGSDTTAVSLSSIVYNLIHHPNVLQKLREEIQQHRDNGTASLPITFKEAQELPYLQAVIKEGLRLHPAVGMSLPRVVPNEGATLAGEYFPGGTVVGTNAWVIHHNKEAFGPDADDFRPERWLESKERSIEMERYFFSFGGGSRTCIGKNISMLEINKLIPELMMRFDFELEEPKKDWELHNQFLVLQQFKCFVTERELV